MANPVNMVRQGMAVGSYRIPNGAMSPAINEHFDCSGIAAAKRALAEYCIATFQTVNAQDVSLKAAYWEISDWEQQAQYPAAAVECDDEAKYVPASLVPRPESGVRTPGTNRWTWLASEIEATITLSLWTANVRARDLLIQQVEQIAFIAGSGDLRIVMPHYHNALASFSLSAITLGDDQDQTNKNLRLAVLQFDASIPVYITQDFAPGLPKTMLTEQVQ